MNTASTPNADQNPLVSIITPAYNVEPFMAETIESALAQTYTNWELIIVVDMKSKDKTFEIAESYAKKDPRIILVRNTISNGASSNRNLAISMSKGEYIAFLDADDTWDPNKLRIQINYMLIKNLQITYHGFQPMSVEGTNLGKPRLAKYEMSYNDLLKNNTLSCLTVVAKADLIKNQQFEDVRHEDLNFWLKMLGKGYTAAPIADVLAKYRLVPNSRSSNKFLCAIWRWQLYRHNNIPFFKAVYYMILYVIFAIYKRI